MNKIPTQDEVENYIDCTLDINKFKQFPVVGKVSIDNAGTVVIQACADSVGDCNEWERVLRRCAEHYGSTRNCELQIRKQSVEEEERDFTSGNQDYYYDIEFTFETL